MEHLGIVSEKKKLNVLRVSFLNVGGLPLQQNNFKEEAIWQGLSTYAFDIFGVAETNTDWRLLQEQDRLYSRTRTWWESLHLSLGHNCATPRLTADNGVETQSSALTRQLTG
jgi:hypothetical protein